MGGRGHDYWRYASDLTLTFDFYTDVWYAYHSCPIGNILTILDFLRFSDFVLGGNAAYRTAALEYAA